jgi:hypothetical protein
MRFRLADSNSCAVSRFLTGIPTYSPLMVRVWFLCFVGVVQEKQGEVGVLLGPGPVGGLEGVQLPWAGPDGRAIGLDQPVQFPRQCPEHACDGLGLPGQPGDVVIPSGAVLGAGRRRRTAGTAAAGHRRRR